MSPPGTKPFAACAKPSWFGQPCTGCIAMPGTGTGCIPMPWLGNAFGWGWKPWLLVRRGRIVREPTRRSCQYTIPILLRLAVTSLLLRPICRWSMTVREEESQLHKLFLCINNALLPLVALSYKAAVIPFHQRAPNFAFFSVSLSLFSTAHRVVSLTGAGPVAGKCLQLTRSSAFLTS